ncbi:MAG: hypothetical protein WC188_04470 [Candidatus Caldatribacteriota bacterium]|jgi:hypothetical protein|nr:hypothetical protein [Patescibacteria group bacterium]
MDLSFIIPCDSFSYYNLSGYEYCKEFNRQDLLLKTLQKYKELLNNRSEKIEFIIVSRTIFNLDFLKDLNLDLKLINYVYDDSNGFAPSKAFNLGTLSALAGYICITSPEVIPITNVINQVFNLPKNNYICKCIDQNKDLTNGMVLVDSNFRSNVPSMYFLAFYLKQNILDINGWDEEFMNGFSFEDDDFGNRFIRAGFNFSVRNDIIGLHQYHPRIDFSISDSEQKIKRNREHFFNNNNQNIIKCRKGIDQYAFK